MSRQPTPTDVRAAVTDDVDEITSMVVAAFASDPAWTYMMGTGNPDAMRAFARLLLLPRISRGTAWVTDDLNAVAMWDRRPTDRLPDDGSDARWAEFRRLVGDEIADRIDTYEDAVHACGPERPYWYLGVLATHPDVQGRGLATRVLEPGFAAARADGWDCWLETSAPGNKAFYAGRGFTDGHEFEVPGGPATWWLRRPIAS